MESVISGRGQITCSSVQILDDVTLSNLDVVDNDGRTGGTLLERIDHTSTPFGKRILCLT